MKMQKIIALSATAAIIFLPNFSFSAESTVMTGVMNHAGELGTIDHNEITGNKSRQDVKTELEKAHKDGTHEMGNEASTARVFTNRTGVGKTREEVKQEFLNMSPEEKKRMNDLYFPGGR